ncbi:flavinator of succinate dehydrogenase [Ketogulonicigenium robustum]|uniref:FAD assembly factor SdhE n=1 Tax=Ketogulonicigenium robustum TaxID=92947 RepID=A0A1W6NZ49_9RHOB|nr:succinate dehydrogenase assembly factor 2 [Ketogulonicigenium robustum]ARO14307.1 flavinator of succinate dehydrogenase [Ketogulonicigenium robustum]
MHDEMRLRRLHMRAIRRGIKEMDLLLGHFAAARLSSLSPAELDGFETLLAENDHDIHAWATGAQAVPDAYAELMAQLLAHADGVKGSWV